MRIVHLLAPAAFGGLESVVRALASGQQARGHDVTVLATIDPGEHPFCAAARRDGLLVVEITSSGRAYARERREVSALLARLSPHVVHSHGYRPDALHLGRARRGGAATVSTLHGFTSGDWKMRLYERLQLSALRQADAVVAVSTGVERRAIGARIPRERVHLIRNAYARNTPAVSRDDARVALGIPLDALTVGWIGRLSPEKGPDVAVEALARMTSPATLHVIGDGADRDSLDSRIASLGIGSRVRFHGAVPDAGRLVRAFDALLLSSRTEGTPMVLLEAMSAGVPIVATAVGGVPDVLPDGAALLAPNEDTAALAAALDATLGDRDASAARAARASSVLDERFGLDSWLDRHDALYASIVR